MNGCAYDSNSDYIFCFKTGSVDLYKLGDDVRAPASIPGTCVRVCLAPCQTGPRPEARESRLELEQPRGPCIETRRAQGVGTLMTPVSYTHLTLPTKRIV